MSAFSALIQDLTSNIRETRDSQRRRRHVRRNTSSPGEKVSGTPPAPPGPTPGVRPRVIRAQFIPYINLTTQQDIYGPNMDPTVDQAVMHIPNGGTPTTAQYNAVKAMNARWRGIEVFTLSDMSRLAAGVKAQGLDFISYDLEGGVGGSTPAELADPVGSMQTAHNTCAAAGLKLQSAATRAINDANAANFAQYVDFLHYQIQSYQEVPATSPPPNFYQETADLVAKVRPHNATCPITVQISTERAAEAGLTILETWQKRWGEVQPLDVAGVSFWFGNNTTALGILQDFVDWFNLNWH